MALINYHQDVSRNPDGDFAHLFNNTPSCSHKTGDTSPYTDLSHKTGDADGANAFKYNKNNYRVRLFCMGLGTLDGTAAVIDTTFPEKNIEDGECEVTAAEKTWLGTAGHYLWVKGFENVEGATQYHYGLYANAESTEDIWEGAFHGATLTELGAKLGLDNTDVVDGRIVKMWAEKSGTVIASCSFKLKVLS